MPLSTTGLTPSETARYRRHLALPEVGEAGQARLKAASVLIVGLGGLGSPAAAYLAAAGIGRLGLCDLDAVDESNLQRQILYGESDIGRTKLEAAKARLSGMNSAARITLHPGLGAGNAAATIAEYGVVVDCTDNFAARFLLADACVLGKKPLVHASLHRFEGRLAVFDAALGPCLRCLYPNPPAHSVPDCAQAGVLGASAGVIGSLQAVEALKLVTGAGTPLIGRMTLYDALEGTFRELRIPKNPACRLCGPDASITILNSAAASCAGRPQERAMSDVPEITVEQLKKKLDAKENFVLLDVREPDEYEAAKIPGSKLIPLGQIKERVAELDKKAELVVHCRSGGRSGRAVAWLRQQGFDKAVNVEGGILAWAERIDTTLNVD